VSETRPSPAAPAGTWSSLSPLWAYAGAGFRRYATYRAATLAGAFTNTMFGLVKASILLAAIAANHGAAVGGYSAIAASTYAWFSQAFLSCVYLFVWPDLAQRIRTGDIAVDLARPVDLQASLLAADLGRAAYSLLPRGLPPLVVGYLTFGLAVPTSPLTWLLGLISLTLAVMISFACRFAVSLIAFWWVEIRGILTLYSLGVDLLCGLIVPVAWFPGWVRLIAAATPFPSMLQAPVDAMIGGSQRQTLIGIAVQCCWLAVTLAVGRLMLRAATRKLVVQGG
jgi:ABC-2 type transport system permease protein